MCELESHCTKKFTQLIMTKTKKDYIPRYEIEFSIDKKISFFPESP